MSGNVRVCIVKLELEVTIQLLWYSGKCESVLSNHDEGEVVYGGTNMDIIKGDINTFLFDSKDIILPGTVDHKSSTCTMTFSNNTTRDAYIRLFKEMLTKFSDSITEKAPAKPDNINYQICEF